MKKSYKYLCALLCVIVTVCLSSCGVDARGDDLSGLLSRVNALSGSTLGAKGFIYSEESREYSSFLRCENGATVLLTCTANAKGVLECVSVTFPRCELSSAETSVTEYIFDAFSKSESGFSTSYLTEINFYQPADAPVLRSCTAESDSLKFTLTRTDTGMCVSCGLKSP